MRKEYSILDERGLLGGAKGEIYTFYKKFEAVREAKKLAALEEDRTAYIDVTINYGTEEDPDYGEGIIDGLTIKV